MSTDIQVMSCLNILTVSFPDPPGIELRQLITENGGEWHTYFNAGCTTYKIAEALAASKWRSITKVEIFLKPAWIVDS